MPAWRFEVRSRVTTLEDIHSQRGLRGFT